jgi:hypothetical protein
MKTTATPRRFTKPQLRKLCTGKPTPSRGYHPSHRCKDVYFITPTGGAVCFYGSNPSELKSRKAWHKEAMLEWMADPLTRRLLEREVRDNLHESRDTAIAASTVYAPTRFIENGRLFFVSKERRDGGVTISQL